MFSNYTGVQVFTPHANHEKLQETLSVASVLSIGECLSERCETLSVAESCTGGQISVACTAVAGASRWFVEGVVTYANSAKIKRLGVSEQSLLAKGAVSAEVASEMAQGVRKTSGATYGIATTGIAGPTGSTPGKPVGTIFVALATPQETLVKHLQCTGTRAENQAETVAVALNMVCQHLHL
jgi:PncC family amidohydrolase